jgi:hypothetical protein
LTHPTIDLGEREKEEVAFSRAVHDSLAKVEQGILEDRKKNEANGAGSKPEGQGADGDGEGEAEDEDDEKEEPASKDQPIPTDRPKGTRHSDPSDGLLGAEDLQTMAKELLGNKGLRSAYADSNWIGLGEQGEKRKGLTFAGRGGEAEFGDNEPAWTSFTP